MRFKYIICIIFLLAPIQVFSQINDITGWQEQNLMHNPKKVINSNIFFTEKFGEPVDEKIGIEELTFNRKGQYLERSFINPTDKDKNEITTYQYDTNSEYLISMDYDAEYFRTADYSYRYEWVNGLISKKTISVDTHGTHHIEYKYDNQRRNIEEIVYDRKGNISEIWRYQYEGSQLIDAKQYDNTGTLRKNKKWKYDSMKNLIRFEEYDKEDEIMVFKVKNNFRYNEHKDIIEEDNCNYYGYNGWSCYNKTFTYEYYSNGLIKKSTQYAKDINDNTVIAGIEEYKSYDNFKNWTEKIIWSYFYSEDEWRPAEKFVREIEYY